MAILIDNKPRIIFPRWRSINNNSSRLILSTEVLTDKHDISRNALIESKNEFEIVKNFSNALEVINAGFSISAEDDIIEEAKFIKSLNKELPNSITSILNKILKDEYQNTEQIINQISNPHLNNIFQEAGRKISKLRNRLNKFPHNPLLWLELSRQYSIVGNFKKAENAAIISLKLSDNSNRFITRSVSRFFVHMKDFEQAQSIVRKAKGFRVDPWLISTDISLSQSLKRIATSSKIGKSILVSGNFSNEDITELAAAVGTEEFLNSSIKGSEKYFHQSLSAPNENSFAQVDFFLDDFKNKQFLIDSINFNYEAQSFELRKQKKFEEAFEKSYEWLIDQPFSRRAAYFNSYLLSGVLEHFEKAIEFGKFSLISNPESFLLTNNITYSYAQLGDIKNAKNYFKKLKKIENRTQQQDVVIIATEGLIKYKEGKIEEGKSLYQKAINEADKQKNRELKILALIHFAREEFESNSINREDLVSIINNIEKEDISKENLQIELNSINRILFRNKE